MWRGTDSKILKQEYRDLKERNPLISKYINGEKYSYGNSPPLLETKNSQLTKYITKFSTEKQKKGIYLTLRVISSVENIFKKGLEVNIDPDGLDENYPFAMKQEDASRYYNLRKEKDGFVYFGYGPLNYLSLSHKNLEYLPTQQMDLNYSSNRQEKLMQMYSHLSDKTSEENKSVLKSWK